MEISPFPTGFSTDAPTVPIREIPLPATLSGDLADFPFRLGEVADHFRLARAFPKRYFDRIEQIRRKSREFADRHIRPHALQIERRASADPNYFAWDVMKKACDYRLFSMLVPEAFGGGGYTVLHMAVMVEELAVGCAGLASTIGVHSAGISCGMVSVDAYLLQKYIRPVVLAERRGEPILWSGAVTEPNAGTDIWDEEFLAKGRIGTFAKKVPGGWRINGRKCFISNGNVARYTVVAAATDPSDPAGSWTIFLCPTDVDGFSVGRVERKMGQKSSPAAEQVFEDVFLGDEMVLGKPGSGARYVSIYLAGSRGPVGAIGVGCARRALECLIDWAKHKRYRGGHLIDQQSIQFEIANMAARILSGRQAYVASSLACDHIFQKILGSPMVKMALALLPGAFLGSALGRRIIQSPVIKGVMSGLLASAAPEDRLFHISALSTAAKILGSDTGVEVAGRVMDLMGPDAYDPRWPVEKCYRDAKLTQIYEGANGANAVTHFKNLVGLMRPGARLETQDEA